MINANIVKSRPQTIHVEVETYSIPRPRPYKSARYPTINGYTYPTATPTIVPINAPKAPAALIKPNGLPLFLGGK